MRKTPSPLFILILGGVLLACTLSVYTSRAARADANLPGQICGFFLVCTFNGVSIGTYLTVTTGELALQKIVPTGVAPGAAGLKVEVVCGTSAHTAKIIAYAGTSTTPVTVVDNVGSGVTGC